MAAEGDVGTEGDVAASVVPVGDTGAAQFRSTDCRSTDGNTVGIQEEDIARVRAATDFVALASEHIALKRVGRQYQGLCPFHSEKSPSFSINPEKGVYYCYGCQASGDVISFVRELEHLDFGQAVERLAAKAGIALRFDNEATGRDRVRRAKLVEAMVKAAAWYHDRLLTSPDAAPARAYLRGRGYDGELVRRFQIGFAPAGWDTLNRSLSLPSDVARDTGLGYASKIGKVNDFFQSRILFPIFDQSGSPVAFGGRKLPGDDGPKYKNSSETKLYSKSRTLYGLNWAKTDVVASGEVIVCEGYTDVIGFHSAGLPRAVATCGTALADEHFRMLKNYARRIVLAYDADNAGQNAAEKFYGWEKQYEIDLFVVALEPGTDPADLARTDPQRLHEAVKNAKPFLAFRVERALRASNLKSPEGRARGFEAAASVVLEHPNAIVREQYLREVAAQCQVSESTMIATLDTYGQRSAAPPPATTRQGGQREPTTTTRPSKPPPPPSARERTSGWAGERPIQNSDPGSGERPPDDDSSAPPMSDELSGDSYRSAGRDNSRDNRQSRPTAPVRSSGRNARTTSPSRRAEAVLSHSRRAEEEVIRWFIADSAGVAGWIHPVLFADNLLRDAVEYVLAHGELLPAVDAAERDDRIDVANALRRLGVDPPLSGTLDDSLALVVSNTADRVVNVIFAERDAAPAEERQAIGSIKMLQEDLREPLRRIEALTQLVPWLSEWHGHRHQVERNPATPLPATPVTIAPKS